MFELRQTCSQQQLQLRGGATRTLFPAVGKVLNSAKTQEMLFGSGLIPTAAYESLLDALFVEVYPEWAEACSDYYMDLGPPLRKVIGESERQQYEAGLLAFVEFVRFYRMLGEDQELPWLLRELWKQVPRPELAK